MWCATATKSAATPRLATPHRSLATPVKREGVVTCRVDEMKVHRGGLDAAPAGQSVHLWLPWRLLGEDWGIKQLTPDQLTLLPQVLLGGWRVGNLPLLSFLLVYCFFVVCLHSDRIQWARGAFDDKLKSPVLGPQQWVGAWAAAKTSPGNSSCTLTLPYSTWFIMSYICHTILNHVILMQINPYSP